MANKPVKEVKPVAPAKEVKRPVRHKTAGSARLGTKK